MSKQPRQHRLAAIATATIALTASGAATAPAASVSADAGGITFVAAAGERNALSITLTPSGCYFVRVPWPYYHERSVCVDDEAARVQDSGAPLSAGAGCGQIDEYTALCGIDGAGYHRATVTLGDEADTAGISSKVVTTLDGGPGDDQLGGTRLTLGGDGSDTITGGSEVRGGSGDDVLRSGGQLFGEGGDDRLSGSESMDGGPGADSFSHGHVTYAARSDVLALSLDGVANDGAAGERDNLGTDVEAVYGGHGNDTLTGGPAYASLDGGPGNDTVRGGPHTDFYLLGGEGDDVIDAGAGDDTLALGEPGADTYLGGAGYDELVNVGIREPLRISVDNKRNDGLAPYVDSVGSDFETIYGGQGTDVIAGGSGAETIYTWCGDDTVTGGAGNDYLSATCYSGGPDPAVVSLDGGAGADELHDSGTVSDSTWETLAGATTSSNSSRSPWSSATTTSCPSP